MAGLATLLLGAAAIGTHPSALAFASALLSGLAISRAMTRSTIARARAAGFEMLWHKTERSAACHRLQPIEMTAELRNRSSELLVLEHIAALAPPELGVRIEPASAIMPPHSSITLKVDVQPMRIGLHGIQGMTVVVRDDRAAFEAQLTFANTIVIEVLPQLRYSSKLEQQGGRGRYRAPATKTRPISGESIELRELREHQRGDPLRKVAWKASARRGTLLVRDDEQEQHSIQHFVLDASVELWSGTMGHSALDLQIDRLASVMRTSLRRGHRVGLTIVGARTLAVVPPDLGLSHERKLLSALVHTATTRDHDRAFPDEQDIATMVLEHLRPIDPVATRKLSVLDIDAIGRLAQRYLLRAPLVTPPEPQAPSPREKTLRRYAAAYGLPSAPKTTTDRDATDKELIEVVRGLLVNRPDRIVIHSPFPTPRLQDGLLSLQRRIRKARIELDWCTIDAMSGLPSNDTAAGQVVAHAMQWHLESDRAKGVVALRKLGIRIPQRFISPPQTPQIEE